MSNKQLASFDAIRKSLAMIKQKRPEFPLEYARLMRLIANIHQRTVDLYNDVLKPFDLTYRTYSSLMSIYSAGEQGIAPSELAEAMGEKRTNITRLCDELTGMGLIVREFGEADLVVSKQGMALIDRVTPHTKEFLTRIYAPLTNEDVAMVDATLYKQLEVLVSMNKGATRE
jgi:MarR family transcriptional repressor of emrRAB